jgi:hypothetical protein
MADPKQLSILRSGVKEWNAWKKQHASAARVDLSGADLSQANLTEANLGKADLTGAHLRQANLAGANLTDACLRGADLRGAYLRGVHLAGADLHRANLTGALVWDTVFGDTDLTSARGLESCGHGGPSIIDHRTLAKSAKLPVEFLRGVGLPDHLIEYLPSLLGEAIQFYECFISYSSRDHAFAERLHADLQNKGVRCWFAPHDLPWGAETGRLSIKPSASMTKCS